jgi:hypothetical protein
LHTVYKIEYPCQGKKRNAQEGGGQECGKAEKMKNMDDSTRGGKE